MANRAQHKIAHANSCCGDMLPTLFSAYSVTHTAPQPLCAALATNVESDASRTLFCSPTSGPGLQ